MLSVTMFASSIASILLGSFLGYIVGLSFLVTKRKAFLLPLHTKKLFLLIVSSSFLRVCFIATIFYFLLQQNFFSPILVLLTLFITFWITIRTKKAIAWKVLNF